MQFHSKRLRSVILGVMLSVFMFSFNEHITNAEENTTYTDDSIFKKDEISTVNIEIDKADFQDMLDNPTAEEYKEATITYNGKTIRYAGVRFKGNSSLSSVAGSESERYSFKLKFDEYIDQNLEGYTKINLNNNWSDPSYMREFLTYELMDQMGIATPKYSYVRVMVNGELYGLYLAVENIEAPYLERNFSSISGNLFKADMGATLSWEEGMSIANTGLEQKIGFETNSNLLSFIEALDNQENVEEYFDVDSYLRYLAATTVLASMDSYQGRMNHNYYLYEQNGKFTFLTWDQNLSIGGMMGNADAQKEMLIDEPTSGAVENYPLVDYVLSNGEYKETYHTYVQEAVDLLDGLEERVEELKTLIGDAVKNDPTAFYTYEEFLANTGDETVDNKPGIVGFMQARIEHVQKQLNGEIPSYENGEGIGGGMGRGGMPEGGLPGGMSEGAPEGMPVAGMQEGGGEERRGAMFGGGDRGGMPGFGGGNQASNPQGQLKDLITVIVLIVLLLGTLIFINRFKRYRA
ncbi:hypothetical protein GCM10008986_13470 [Salinibacillus aidingensis]|uniref:Spore coat protein CotH n=1 Tax=Salinibacillus aidingensis TaxID=237684 RepID=A0ABN1B399_9BACI